jgi:flagellar motility protein MotE (MotC chaperone)
MTQQAPTSLAGKRKALRDRRNAPRVRAPYLRVLPLTMMMAVLLLGVKVRDVYQGGMELKLRYDAAYAEDAPAEAKTQEHAAEAGEDKAGAHGGETAAGAEGETPAAALSPEAEEALKTKILEEKFKLAREKQFSNIELDILQSLAERREGLEERGRELDLKEKLLEATELRINDKISELKGMEEELTTLLKSYDEKQTGEIQSLVKIYENMKPKSAAEIFNQLDLPILLEVIDKMSERKVAPVLAGMAPERAREVTEELAVLRKLRAEKRRMAEQ